MEAIALLTFVVSAMAISYVVGRVRGVRELRYQRRMAEQWYVAYRRQRTRAARLRVEGDEWKDGRVPDP